MENGGSGAYWCIFLSRLSFFSDFGGCEVFRLACALWLKVQERLMSICNIIVVACPRCMGDTGILSSKWFANYWTYKPMPTSSDANSIIRRLHCFI